MMALWVLKEREHKLIMAWIFALCVSFNVRNIEWKIFKEREGALLWHSPLIDIWRIRTQNYYLQRKHQMKEKKMYAITINGLIMLNVSRYVDIFNKNLWLNNERVFSRRCSRWWGTWDWQRVLCRRCRGIHFWLKTNSIVTALWCVPFTLCV